jgi:hypothetical protein
MPMMSAHVRVTDLDGLDASLSEIMDAVDQNLEETARFVEQEARVSAAFQDKTGKLRKSIKLKKSKFEDGGWIVQARAPHAHLVEFGHVKWLWGRPTGDRVPPHPFLRPALEKGIRHAVAKFKGGVKNG